MTADTNSLSYFLRRSSTNCDLWFANSHRFKENYSIECDPSARNQSHVGRVRFPLRAEMHGRAHITDSCFIAFITSKIC